MSASIAVARVYAQALLDLAEAQGNLPRVVDDLHAVQDLVDKDKDFSGFFATHRLERGQKRKILNEALADKLDRPVLGLLNILIDKQRELVLDNIVDEFDRFRDLRAGVLHAYVVTARPLDDEQRADVTRRLEASTGKKIKIHEKVEPRLLGGMTVRLGDKVIDGTARTKLERLKRALVSVGET